MLETGTGAEPGSRAGAETVRVWGLVLCFGGFSSWFSGVSLAFLGFLVSFSVSVYFTSCFMLTACLCTVLLPVFISPIVCTCVSFVPRFI